MKARRLTPWLAFPLALGLLGCPDDDAPYDQPMHDPAVEPGEERPGWEGTYEDPVQPTPLPGEGMDDGVGGGRTPSGPEPATPPPEGDMLDQTGTPTIPQDTADPMHRGGGTTGDTREPRPQPPQRDQVHPGQ